MLKLDVLALGVLALVAASGVVANADADSCNTIAATAQEAGLTTLANTITGSEFETAATGTEAKLTVFAPINEAFNPQPIQDLLAGADPALIDGVLGMHIVDAVEMAAALTDNRQLATITGEILMIGRSGDTVTVTDPNGNTATVTTPDVMACDSVVHVIDSLLLPPADTAAGTDTESDTETGTDNETGTTTTTTPGTTPTTPEAGTETTDAGTGTDTTTTPVVPAVVVVAADPECPTIAETAAGNELTSLASAIATSPYNDAVNDNTSTLTVFAPSNAAFAVEATQELLEAATPEQVNQILGVHIVNEAVTFAELTDGSTLTTIEGDELKVSKTGNVVTITGPDGNTANVGTADVQACNSVIHTIDNVLQPASLTGGAASVKAGLGAVLAVAAAAFLL